MWLIDELAEACIAEARERGAFNDLPAAGRPLLLDDDTLVPEELRVGYRLLKNAGYLPPELELRCEIADVEQLLAVSDTATDRTQAARRLSYLRLRLSFARGGVADLRMEEAYFNKLFRKLQAKEAECRF